MLVDNCTISDSYAIVRRYAMAKILITIKLYTIAIYLLLFLLFIYYILYLFIYFLNIFLNLINNIAQAESFKIN